MKHFTLMILSFFMTSALMAQFGVQFPTTDAVWVVRKSTLNQTGTVQFNYQSACSSNTQITVGGKTYTEMNRCGAINSLGAFREEDNRVYYLAPDSTNEYIAYDFNLTVGETIDSVIYMNGYSFYEYPYYQFSGLLTVSAVSTVNYNGVDRKKIEFVDSPATWIEGIGNTTGFLLDNESNVSGYGLELICMSMATNSIFPVTAAGECVKNVGLTSPKNEKLDFSLSPNPSSGSFYIQSNVTNEKMEINITDLNGKVVSQYKNHTSIEKIVTILKAGAYIVNVTTDGKTNNTQLIIE